MTWARGTRVKRCRSNREDQLGARSNQNRIWRKLIRRWYLHLTTDARGLGTESRPFGAWKLHEERKMKADATNTRALNREAALGGGRRRWGRIRIGSRQVAGRLGVTSRHLLADTFEVGSLIIHKRLKMRQLICGNSSLLGRLVVQAAQSILHVVEGSPFDCGSLTGWDAIANTRIKSWRILSNCNGHRERQSEQQRGRDYRNRQQLPTTA